MSAERNVPRGNLVRLEGARVALGEEVVLDGLDLAIDAGQPVALIGPNGAGKTTLLRLLMGLLPLETGRLKLGAGEEGAAPRRAIVFQKPVMLRRSVSANVALALVAAGFPAEPAKVLNLLARVGLATHAVRPARKLSQGEQQRLALARALAREPELLLLDEPTASLDPAQAKVVEEIIAQVAAGGVTVVMATHDLAQARRLCGRVALLIAGRIAETGRVEEFFRQPTTETARRFLAGEIILGGTR